MIKSLYRYLSPILYSIALILLGCVNSDPTIALTLTSPGVDSVYEYRTLHSPDGIGKFYLGREIAQVMGHQGAGWLETFWSGNLRTTATGNRRLKFKTHRYCRRYWGGNGIF